MELNSKTKFFSLFFRYSFIIVTFFQTFQLLTIDWLIGTRKIIWETQMETSGQDVRSFIAPSDQLDGFQRDLTCLRKLTENNPAALPRVCLYEALMRMMSGASPNKTQLLLERSLRKRNNSSSIICTKGLFISFFLIFFFFIHFWNYICLQ